MGTESLLYNSNSALVMRKFFPDVVHVMVVDTSSFSFFCAICVSSVWYWEMCFG